MSIIAQPPQKVFDGNDIAFTAQYPSFLSLPYSNGYFIIEFQHQGFGSPSVNTEWEIAFSGEVHKFDNFTFPPTSPHYFTWASIFGATDIAAMEEALLKLFQNIYSYGKMFTITSVSPTLLDVAIKFELKNTLDAHYAFTTNQPTFVFQDTPNFNSNVPIAGVNMVIGEIFVNGDMIERMELSPDVDRATFYFDKIIKRSNGDNIIGYDFSNLLGYNNPRYYHAQFRRKLSGVIDELSDRSDKLYVYRGGQKLERFIDPAKNVLSTSDKLIFRTHTEFYSKVSPFQPVNLYVIANDDIDVIETTITLTNAVTNGGITYLPTTFPVLTTVGVIKDCSMLRIPIGIANHQAALSGLGIDVPNLEQGVVTIEIKVKDSFGAVLETYNYTYRVTCHEPNNRYLLFENALGGYDSLCLKNVSKETMKVERLEMELINDVTISTNYRYTREVDLDTQPLTSREEEAYMSELMMSKAIYEIEYDNKENPEYDKYVKSYIIPITKDYPVKVDNVGNRKMEFRYKYSQKELNL